MQHAFFFWLASTTVPVLVGAALVGGRVKTSLANRQSTERTAAVDGNIDSVEQADTDRQACAATTVNQHVHHLTPTTPLLPHTHYEQEQPDDGLRCDARASCFTKKPVLE
jgi:hypothetical protein